MIEILIIIVIIDVIIVATQSYMIRNSESEKPKHFLGGKVIKIYNISYWLFFGGNGSM